MAIDNSKARAHPCRRVATTDGSRGFQPTVSIRNEIRRVATAENSADVHASLRDAFAQQHLSHGFETHGYLHASLRDVWEIRHLKSQRISPSIAAQRGER
jgi:hypothetical protein